MIAKDKIFREYDIRGVVGTDFDAELALRLGRALGTKIISENPEHKVRKVAVGYDCRLTNLEMSGAITQGLRECGLDVVDTGMGATPQLYYSVFSMGLIGGVQVTASHNPGDQNGFKMMVGKRTLSGRDIQELRLGVHELTSPKEGVSLGKLEKVDAQSAYLEELVKISAPKMGKRKLKIVVDGGNGVGGPVGPELLRRLGCEVIELYTDPDGRFPNHHPDPTELKNIVEMRKRVVAENADCGIAWDGDADRIGVVDERAEPIWGDMLLVIYGTQLAKEVSGAKVIADVKCSELLFSDLRSKGVEAIMWKTGHSLIKAKLQETGAHLAGEMSGHMFFKHRYFGYDDALHASARLVEILSNVDGPLSALLSGVPKSFSTPEIRVDCPEEIKFEVAEKAKSAFPEYESITIDGVRVKFPDGWGLVRASNTQPALVMRFEATSEAKLAEYKSLVEGRIKELQRQLGH